MLCRTSRRWNLEGRGLILAGGRNCFRDLGCQRLVPHEPIYTESSACASPTFLPSHCPELFVPLKSHVRTSPSSQLPRSSGHNEANEYVGPQSQPLQRYHADSSTTIRALLQSSTANCAPSHVSFHTERTSCDRCYRLLHHVFAQERCPARSQQPRVRPGDQGCS